MKSMKSTERVINTAGSTSIENGVINEQLTSVNTQNRQILIKELTDIEKKPSIKIQEDDMLDDLLHTPSIMKSF